jgi:hypothetical protein
MALNSRLHFEDDRSAILLIGIDERQPLTIIEGNHRMTAAALTSPAIALSRFRYFCGFSPHMTRCCWYQTSLTTLWRYARNRAKILLYDRDAELALLVRHYGPSDGNGGPAAQPPAAAAGQIAQPDNQPSMADAAADNLRREAS